MLTLGIKTDSPSGALALGRIAAPGARRPRRVGDRRMTDSTGKHMNIAIIGCGYVGSALGDALSRAGHNVLGTTTRPERADELRALGIRPAVVMLNEVAAVASLLGDREVVYLTIAAGRKDSDYRRVYVEGIRCLLDAASNTPVKRIIYTSSTSVYGQNDGDWVDETSPTEPTSERGRLLLEAERTLLDRAEQDGIVATVLRLAGIYGPDREPASWLARCAGQERSDGDAYLNLVHRDDIVAALIALLDVAYRGVLNLNDDTPITRGHFYDRLAAASDVAPVRWTRSTESPTLGRRVRNDLAKRTLGLVLKHPTH